LKIRVFPNGNDASMRCFLCKQTMDSHDHLFVQCTYAEEVWKILKSLRVNNSANVQKVANEWGIIFKHGIVDPEIMKTINSPCNLLSPTWPWEEAGLVYVSLLHCHRRMDGSKEGGCSLSSDASPSFLLILFGEG
ncbi:RNA-directed DNA polymerase, eukaryota, reverse transcriptase zinc-binding domain protein, partial [Tanacetum coccineum]